MLHEIAESFKKNKSTIDEFFAEKTQNLIPPLYLSCDIRNSGKKLGVIDSNLFPAGFNNLCNSYSRRASVAFRSYFNTYYPSIENIIILSEDHTRNRYYLENIHYLKALLEAAGLATAVAFSSEALGEESLEFPLTGDQVLKMHPLKIQNGRPVAGNLRGDLIISNNDFSAGVPPLLQPLADRVIPSPALGWHRRRKSHHFTLLREVTTEFAHRLNLDPWLLNCEFDSLSISDWTDLEELKGFSKGVEKVFHKIQKKYQEYQIQDSPYVFIKNDSGTYGMGLIDVSDPQELLRLNRRQRNKLSSTKGGKASQDFLIQEGIPTADFYSNLPIEPVIYMVGWDSIGGFFRMNTERDAISSLNTRGMIFSCLCLHKVDEPHEDFYLNCAEKENLVAMATIMARLAALAGALEMKELKIAA